MERLASPSRRQKRNKKRKAGFGLHLGINMENLSEDGCSKTLAMLTSVKIVATVPCVFLVSNLNNVCLL